MESDHLETVELFGMPQNSAISFAQQNGRAPQPNATAQQLQQRDQALWDAAMGSAQAGLSDSASTGPSGTSLPTFAQQQSSAAATDLSFGSLSGPSLYEPAKQTNISFNTGAGQSAGQSRKRDIPERKRTKLNSDAAALESVDYWIQFDDDDPENRLGESFEIDFSKRRNNNLYHKRYVVLTAL
jgi:hypothetical protein